MEVIFTDKELTDSRSRKGSFSDCCKQIERRLEQFLAVDNLEQFEKDFPQARCHAYSGKEKGRYTVDVSGNRRLLFCPTSEPSKKDDGVDKAQITSITILGVIDPH